MEEDYKGAKTQHANMMMIDHLENEWRNTFLSNLSLLSVNSECIIVSNRSNIFAAKAHLFPAKTQFATAANYAIRTEMHAENSHSQ